MLARILVELPQCNEKYKKPRMVYEKFFSGKEIATSNRSYYLNCFLICQWFS